MSDRFSPTIALYWNNDADEWMLVFPKTYREECRESPNSQLKYVLYGDWQVHYKVPLVTYRTYVVEGDIIWLQES